MRERRALFTAKRRSALAGAFLGLGRVSHVMSLSSGRCRVKMQFGCGCWDWGVLWFFVAREIRPGVHYRGDSGLSGLTRMSGAAHSRFRAGMLIPLHGRAARGARGAISYPAVNSLLEAIGIMRRQGVPTHGYTSSAPLSDRSLVRGTAGSRFFGGRPPWPPSDPRSREAVKQPPLERQASRQRRLVAAVHPASCHSPAWPACDFPSRSTWWVVGHRLPPSASSSAHAV